MPKDHLIRMAGRIHRQLSQSTASSANWDSAMNDLIARLRLIRHQWQLSRYAANRGWHSAARYKNQQMLSEASQLEAALIHLRSLPPPSLIQSNPPTVGTILAELRQVQDEFEDFKIDLKQGLVSVTIPPVVLEEINLGPFTIELNIDRLRDRQNSDCFRCIALDPNPAANNEDTVHPHVQNDRLCSGDAGMPIAAALQEGRIADAFVLMRSVLSNYNPSSPYVSLENWSGEACAECGYVTDSEDLFYCDSCEKYVCEDCVSGCDMCDHSTCHSCLDMDDVSGNRCCSSCRHSCSKCNRIVDSESFDQESELCPACLEKQQSTQEENNHESSAQSPDPATITTVIATPQAPAVPAAA